MKTIVISIILAISAVPSNEPTPLVVRLGQEVVINVAVNRDIYVAGGTIIIDAPVYGDVIAAGGTVIVNDTISMDVLVGGGTVTINGFVGDDLRCAGGSVTVNGNVKGDVIATGGKFRLEKKSIVDGNLLASGGEISIEGNVGGDTKLAAGELTLTGDIGGNLSARCARISIDGTVGGESNIGADEIFVGRDARFLGDVNYWNSAESLEIQQQAGTNKVRLDPSLTFEAGRWELLGFTSVALVVLYLGAALLTIWLLQFLFSKTFSRAAVTALEQSLKSVGLGFLFFVGVPLATVICFVTIVGIPIGLMMLFAYVMFLVLATAITAVVISNWFSNVYGHSSWTIPRLAFSAFGIFIVLKLISLTPFIGPFVMIVTVCMSFGAILLALKYSKFGSSVTKSTAQ